MKRFISVATILLTLMLSVSMSFAGGQVFTDGGGTGAALPADSNGYTVLYALGFNATNATGDVIVYIGDNSSTTLLNAEAASQTALTVSSVSGFDDNDYVVIYSPTGDLLEFNQVTATNGTTGVFTVTALGDAFPINSVIYELKVKATLADVGATTLHWSNEEGLFGAPLGKPLGVRITDGTIYYASGKIK